MGVYPESQRRCRREEKTTSYRTPGGQRRFLKREIERFAGIELPTTTVCDGRVSSYSQRDDLERQPEYLRLHNEGAEFISEIVVRLNFRRRKFKSILERIIKQDIQRLVVAHRDRLCRLGWELVEWYCLYNAVQLVVQNVQQLSRKQKLVQDMLSSLHGFSCRLCGLRKYRKKEGSPVREESVTTK
ncbi:MAG: IS607 family transposase [Hormoscilla sp.]